MKATNSSPNTNLAVRALQLVGLIMIVSFLLDLLTLFIPPDLLNTQWRLNFTTQVIDRGVIPLVGVVFLLIGMWFSESVGNGSSRSANLSKVVAVILSLILGVLYLGVAPLHGIDTIRDRNLSLRRVEQEATRAETQLQSQVNNPQFQAQIEQQQQQFKSQVSELLSDEQRLNELISSGQIAGPQADLLQEFKANPQALDQFVEQQSQDLPDRALTRIRETRRNAEQEIQLRSAKSVSRSLSSGLLAIAFLGIAFTGFTGGVKRTKGRRKTAGA